MADEILIFDAAGSNVDGTNPGSALSVGPGTSYNLIAHDYPEAELEVLYASSVDTEGERRESARRRNRTITITLDMVDSTDALLKALQVKHSKLARLGGTLKRTMKNGDVRIYDIIAAQGWSPRFDIAYVVGDLTEVTMTLLAAPFSRGAEQDLGDNVETTLPWLVFTDSIPGDVEALGRVVIDNDDATNDQWWVAWGLQSENYSSATSAALAWQAESLTAMGGSATAVGPTGASGAGSNVMRNTSLGSAYQAILSTQATGGGAHMSHVGSFHVWARFQVPTTNTGTVSVALEWGEGDFRRYSRNTATAINPVWEGTWQLVDLGLVTLTKVTQGTQRWEGRILAKSTVAGDDIDIDHLELFPVDEGYGEVSTPLRVSTPTTFSARDEFDQSAGALAAKTLPVGGTWSGAGDTDDFAVSGTGSVTRATTLDSGATFSGRLARAGTGTATNVVVQADITGGVSPQASGVAARYVDSSNTVIALVNWGATTNLISVQKYTAGVLGGLGSGSFTGGPSTVTITLVVLANGLWSVLINGKEKARGQDTALATGGTLATGGYGIYDVNSGAAAGTRTYDNFAAWVPVNDAAIFASQSLEIRSDRITREDSGGTLWLTPSSYKGTYLRIPPAGAEAKTMRMLINASRSVPGEGPDSGIDDISARLFVTPRYLI